MMKCRFVSVLTILFLAIAGCSPASQQVVELKHFPLDSLEGVIAQSEIQLDRQNSSDGKGSLRIDTSGPVVVRLFEVSNTAVENARLTYQAKIRTENLEGQAYLEMWCHFSGKGEFFSRGLQSPVTGTSNWTTVETPFFLQQGEKPDSIKLNIVINGKGTAWIDDIRLIKGPLK